jgi:signal transduction histidine kinase
LGKQKKIWKPILWAGAVFLISVSITLAFYFDYRKERKVEYYDNLRLQAHNAQREVTQLFDQSILGITNLSKRIEVSNGTYFDFWEEDAATLISQNPAYKFVEWIDSGMVIRKIYPVQGNEAVIDLDISKLAYRASAWIAHTQNEKTNITPWVKLTQGGYAFLIDAPLHYNQRFQGTITAGMDFTPLLESDISSGYNDFALQLKDHKGTVFYAHNDPQPGAFKDGELVELPIVLAEEPDAQWSLTFMPTTPNPTYFDETRLRLALLFGLIISLLLAGFIFSYFRVIAQDKQIKRINKEQRKLNQELKKEQEKALKASAAKSDFLANISHEIRTPLNALVGFIDLMKSDGVRQAHKEYLSLMDISAQTLLALVNDVLDIKHIASGKIEMRNDAFVPSKTIKDAISVYEEEAKNKGLSVRQDFKGSSFAKVLGDQGKLKQVFTNILRNAIKFTEQGEIEVRYKEVLREGEQCVEIWVQDTGVGIPEHLRESIFERFTQGEASLTKQYKGSGLGLSISKQLANLMEGDVLLESSSTKGSTFYLRFSFPFLSWENVNKRLENTAALQKPIHQTRALIVEDNLLNVTVLKLNLKAMGIQCAVAENGKIGVDMAKEGGYDVIFMDIHMPLMDGFEATRQIRAFDKNTPIIALTANISPESKEKAMELGFDEYMTKPLDPKLLKVTLAKYFVLES